MRSKARSIFILSALIVTIIVIWICASGCQSKPKLQPTDASVNLGGAHQGAWGHLESLVYNIKQSMAFMGSETGKQFLIAALAESDAAFAQLTKAMQAHEKISIGYNTLVKQSMYDELRLRQYHDQWIGDRTWRWIWVIVGAWAVAGFTSMIVGGFFSTGLLATLSGSVLRLLPFANLFVRGRDIIRAKRAGGTVVIVRDGLGSVVTEGK